MPSRNAIPVRRRADASRQEIGRDAAAQHQWRSSLYVYIWDRHVLTSCSDLIWSYSRSQAYFGDNITTSPSFVDRRWCGTDEEGNIPDSDADLEHDSDVTRPSDAETSADDTGDVEAPEGLGADRSTARVRDRGMLNSVPQDMYYHSFEPVSSGIRPHADYDEEMSDDTLDESARSRSRSPKSLGTAEPRRSRLRLTGVHDRDRDPSRPPRDSAAYRTRSSSRARYHRQLRAAAPGLRDPYDIDESPPRSPARPVHRPQADERTPLVPAEHVHRIDSGMSDAPSHGHGYSTFSQTWFNTVNALMGVGVLSLPLAFAYAGWIGAPLLFLLCGALTNYSGKLLARIMAREPQLHTYADIGSYAFGTSARVFVGTIFSMEMLTVSVALIILIGDSLTALMYGEGLAEHKNVVLLFKIVGFAVTLPTMFLPLGLLSPISLVGITSIVMLFCVILLDGLLKREAPGSLYHPLGTQLSPDWRRVAMSFGLVMSGFSAHPVIPSLYRDMKRPAHFGRMLDLAYVATGTVYLVIGMVGYLMFGRGVSDEVTRDLARTPGFPRTLTTLCVLLMAINPMTKFALAIRPVHTMVEKYLGVMKTPDGHPPDRNAAPAAPKTTHLPSTHHHSPSHEDNTRSQRHATYTRTGVRVGLAVLVTFVACAVPKLETVMGFLGAFLAFTTCILGPILAHLKTCHSQMSWFHIVRDLSVLSVTTVLAIFGTIWAFLPTSPGHV